MAQAITMKQRWEFLMAQAIQHRGGWWISDGSSHHREAALGILDGPSHQHEGALWICDGSSHHHEAALGIFDGSSHQHEGRLRMSDGSSHHHEAALGILMAQAISTKEGGG